ncbi:MAG: hypothetical protein ABW193_01605 [Luteibacter sp.]
MKFMTGALAGVLMIAGFATATPALAAQDCAGCIRNYNNCIAAGGNSATCWTCNNPTCSPFGVRDSQHDTLGQLSTNKSDALARAGKRAATTLLHS